MRTLIIYCSKYRNNTGQIAACFAERSGGTLLSLSGITQVDPMAAAGFDLIGFGSGVYYEDLAPEVFKAAQRIDVTGKKTFVFSTSGAGLSAYNNGLIKTLMAKGASNLGSFACRGEFSAPDFTNNRVFYLMGKLSKGHPGQKDLAKAQRFIETVLAAK